MLKQASKLTTLATLIASTSLSYAGAMGVPCSSYHYQAGPYIGASVGSLINTTSTPSFYRGAAGTLSGGWGMIWNQSLYLALEGFGGSNANVKNFPLNKSTAYSVKSSWFYGGDIIPGVLIHDSVLAYLRGGVIQTNFDDIDQQKTAWQAGIGLQTNMYKNVDIRLEYIFSEYRGFSITSESQLNTRPIQDLINLGLVYKFV